MPVIVTLLPCKSVTMNLRFLSLFIASLLVALKMASSIVNFDWLFYRAITEYCYALGY